MYRHFVDGSYPPPHAQILEGNVALESEPGKINEDPLGDGELTSLPQHICLKVQDNL